jgi:hypothetical protein
MHCSTVTRLHLLGCVNMLQWRIIPGSAFPIARWAAGSGSIYCDGGQYCPNTTTSLGCPRGHFCRQGEWEPARCPPGATCPPNTEVFEANYTGGFCCMVAWVVKLLQMLAGQLSVRLRVPSLRSASSSWLTGPSSPCAVCRRDG